MSITTKKIHNFCLYSFAIFLSFMLSACDHTPDKQKSETKTNIQLKGTFIDSPVTGLNYRTNSTQGTTDEDGQFIYSQGEIITFSIGSIDLPSTIAKAVLTPLDLAGTDDINDPEVVNIARLLQTLDNDNNQENGIQINETIHNEIDASSLQFDSPNFSQNAQNILSNTNLVNSVLVDDTSAIAHMESSLASIDENYDVRTIYKSNIEHITNQTIDEDDEGILIKLESTSDADQNNQTPTIFSVTSLDQQLFPNTNVLLQGTGDNTTLAITPQGDQSGDGRFILTEIDGPLIVTRVFIVSVNAINDTPVANDRAINTNIGTSYSGGLEDFANDIEKQTLSFSAISQPNHGTVTLDTNGSFIYQPEPFYSGEDSFSYLVSDGVETSNEAQVLISINGILDTENTNDAPIAHEHFFSTQEESTFSENLLAEDAENTPLSYSIISNGSKGIAEITNTATGAFIYTPFIDATGTDSFTYKVNDGELDSNAATITIDISDVNDAPFITAIPNQSIVAGETISNLEFIISDNESNEDALSLTISSSNSEILPLSNIVETGENAERTLTLNTTLNQTGTTTITIAVNDGELSTTTSFTVNIIAPNSPPTSTDTSFETDEDTPLIDSLNNEEIVFDEDGDFLEFSIITEPSNGTLTWEPNGKFTYTPKANYSGADEATFSVYDGQTESNISTITFIITSINNEPSATNDTLILDEDTFANINVLANDTDLDGDTLSVTATSANQGSVNINEDNSLRYTPNTNFAGNDTISYTIEDGKGGATTGTVSVTINTINDTPIATSNNVETPEDTTFSGSLIASDIDSEALTYRLIVAPELGEFTLTDTSTGAYTYVPFNNVNGVDSFSFKANDGAKDSNQATVTITITPDNDKPVIIAEIGDQTINENSSSDLLNFTISDIETPPESLLISISSSNPTLFSADSFVLGGEAGERNLIATPVENSNGIATITITISDGTESSLTSFNITVLADQDHDGVIDLIDNCPTIDNEDQLDSDENGVGDACELVTNVVLADANLQSCVNEYLAADNELMITEMTELSCVNYSIVDASGIESLTSLQTIDLSQNLIEHIDVSTLANLKHLNLSDNNLNLIDVTNNDDLVSLDLSNYTYFDALEDCFSEESETCIETTAPINKLTQINLSNNLSLTTLRINRYASEYFDAYGYGIDSLDLSLNTLLTTLEFSSDRISDIDLSTTASLTTLKLDTPFIDSIDLSMNIALTSLELFAYNITSIDLSANTALTSLDLYLDSITSLDLNSNTVLTSLDIASRLASLDLSNNIELSRLNIYSYTSYYLTSIDLSNNPLLTDLNLSDTSLTSIDLSNNPLLRTIDLSQIDLALIDLSTNTLLTEVDLSGNQFSAINLEENTELTALILNDNNFSTINLDANTNLESVYLNSNPLLNETKSYLDSLSIDIMEYDNNPPIADAGEAQYFETDQTFTVSLDGSLSRDDDGEIVSYLWNQLTGSNIVLSDENNVSPNFTTNIAIPQVMEFSLTVTDQRGKADTSIIAIQFGSPDVIVEIDFETGDLSQWPLPLEGDAEWFVSTSKAHQGTYSFSSPTLSDSQQARATVTTPTLSGVVSFWYSVSSESGYDALSFYVDGILQERWSGEIDWTQATYSVSPGIHEFTLVYSKDGSVSQGEDTAWVDDISIPVDLVTDTDNDGLTNSSEISIFFTDPFIADTDSNGTLDGDEDTDTDGLSDSAEINTYFTNPFNADTDSDGTIDGDEVTLGTNPLVNENDIDNDGIANASDNCPTIPNPEQNDQDSDGIGNACEVLGDQVFADENFQVCITEAHPDTSTLVTEIISLDCRGRGIETASGIEQLTELTTLIIRNNNLSSIDVSQNIKLTDLSVTYNNLSSIDISANTALTSFSAHGNELSLIDISANTALTILELGDNNLSSVDISANTALTNLSLSDNVLTSIDISTHSALTDLSIGGTMSSIDISANTALTSLSISSINLTSIDVSPHTALTWLYVRSDNLSSIDVSENTALTSLSISGIFSTIDISANTLLTFLSVSSDNLSSIDVSVNTALTRLWTSNSNLSSIDVATNTALTELLVGNNNLSSIDISTNTALTRLDVSYNGLTSLDISTNSVLATLYAWDNNLSSINFSAASVLTDLRIERNNLSSIDLSTNSDLKTLVIRDNNLSSIDVSANNELTYLDIQTNPLSLGTIDYLNSLSDQITNLYF